MRLGILTFHSVDNYGAVLQTFALQTYLSSLGHSVEIIDYRPAYFHSKPRPVLRPDRFIGRLVMSCVSRRFEVFRREHLKRTTVCYSETDLERRLPIYDLLIAGSDQIWNPTVDRRTDVDPIYFFSWNVPSTTRRISYAASFGTSAIDARFKDKIAKGLSAFDSISVREESGIEIVKTLCGKKAVWVCDPVFLLGGDWWRKTVCMPTARYNSVFSYMPPRLDTLNGFAKFIGSQVVTTGWNVRGLVSKRISYSNPSPLGWVRQIGSSSCMLTKSFHGLAFSIMLHTPFVYWLPDGDVPANAERCISLLRYLGLDSRIVKLGERFACNVADKFQDPIDWDGVDDKLSTYVQRSKDYLDAVV